MKRPETGHSLRGNEGSAVYVSESGLYSLILRSKLSHAKAFQRWVLRDVLPTIRRTGSYVGTAAGQASVSDEHHKAIRETFDAVLESTGQQRVHRIDAAEILRRRGHVHSEVVRLATEFGKAMIIASERIGQHLAPIDGGARRYHIHDDAGFVNSVHRAFQKRDLYIRVCAPQQEAHAELDRKVDAALRNGRGHTSRERSPRRQITI